MIEYRERERERERERDQGREKKEKRQRGVPGVPQPPGALNKPQLAYVCVRMQNCIVSTYVCVFNTSLTTMRD
jgi:hypothetical protein